MEQILQPLMTYKKVYFDDRGSFCENWKVKDFPDLTFKQNNISHNLKKGTIRGIHTEPWWKYVSVAHGSVLAVVVDLQYEIGKVYEWELTQEKSILIPPGFGNSYETLEDNTIYTYMVTEYWDPSAEYVTINPFDKILSINWRGKRKKAILSKKDLNGISFAEYKYRKSIVDLRKKYEKQI